MTLNPNSSGSIEISREVPARIATGRDYQTLTLLKSDDLIVPGRTHIETTTESADRESAVYHRLARPHGHECASCRAFAVDTEILKRGKSIALGRSHGVGWNRAHQDKQYYYENHDLFHLFLLLRLDRREHPGGDPYVRLSSLEGAPSSPFTLSPVGSLQG